MLQTHATAIYLKFNCLNFNTGEHVILCNALKASLLQLTSALNSFIIIFTNSEIPYLVAMCRTEPSWSRGFIPVVILLTSHPSLTSKRKHLFSSHLKMEFRHDLASASCQRLTTFIHGVKWLKSFVWVSIPFSTKALTFWYRLVSVVMMAACME